MKKMNTDIRDIYRAQNSPPEQNPSWSIQDAVEQEIHRRRVFNLLISLLMIALACALTIAFVTDYLPASQKPATSVNPPNYITARDLPEDEQWALEYQVAASQADASEPAGAKKFTSKWVKNAAYHVIMGEQAIKLGDFPSAQAHLERALTTFPELSGVHRPLGLAYLKQQFFKPAAEQLQMAMKETPSPDVLNNLGAAYIGSGENDRAETVLKQAVQQNPNPAGCYKNLILLYQRTGRTNDAVKAFENYFAQDPKDSKMLEAYAAYLTAAGRSRDVISFMENLKTADPLTTRRILAKAAALNNDADRAVQALREMSSLLTPRQLIAVMHDPVFDRISKTAGFESLLYQMELAAVSLTSGKELTGQSP
jgi:tetratricopeptide (TPR) repeat protein